MKKGVAYFHSYLFVFLTLSIVLSGCSSTTEETLKRIAEDTSKRCPQVVDEYTTMTNCEVLPNRTLKFTYVIQGVYDNANKAGMTDAMKQILIRKLQERKEFEFYSINNVRFEHLYLDGQGNTVMDVDVEALDYK